jgi:hypothetical protein
LVWLLDLKVKIRGALSGKSKTRRKSMKTAIALCVAVLPFGPSLACDRPYSGEISKAIMENRVIMCMTQAEVLRSAGTDPNHQVTKNDVGVEVWFFTARHETFPESVRFDADGYVAYYGDSETPPYWLPRR